MVTEIPSDIFSSRRARNKAPISVCASFGWATLYGLYMFLYGNSGKYLVLIHFARKTSHKITTLIKSSTIFAIVFEISLIIHAMANIDLWILKTIILLSSLTWPSWIFVKTIIKSNPKSFSPLSQCSTSIESLKCEVELIIKILCNMFLESANSLYLCQNDFSFSWFLIGFESSTPFHALVY